MTSAIAAPPVSPGPSREVASHVSGKASAPAPTLAVINAIAMGGGLDLALSMLFSGAPVTDGRACETGRVNDCRPDEELDKFSARDMEFQVHVLPPRRAP